MSFTLRAMVGADQAFDLPKMKIKQGHHDYLRNFLFLGLELYAVINGIIISCQE